MKPFCFDRVWHSRKESGAVLIFVVGLIVVITIIMALTLNWYTNLSRNQLRISETELREIEPHNLDKIIKAVVRRRIMLENDRNILVSSDTNLFAENLTHNTRTERQEQGFELTTNVSLPSIPSWFSSSSFTQKNPEPKLSDPLFYLWHIPHDLYVTAEMRLWQDNPPADALEREAVEQYLPMVTNVTRLHLREIPSCQIQLTAVDRFDAPKCDMKVNVEGIGLFPYGVTGGAQEYGGSVAVKQAVSTEDWTKGAFNETYKYISPGLAVSWMMDPYLLTQETSESYNTPPQKYYPKSNVIAFDGGETLFPSDDSAVLKEAIKVMRYEGIYRVVVDVALLSEANAYYINCTNPLAKQRGVVVIGTGGGSGAVSIITNGALRLAGEQTSSSLVVGTSYGGVVFTDGGASPSGANNAYVWRSYICTPVRPPVVLASSEASSSFPDQSYAIESLSSAIGGAATISLPNPGLNYDTIQLSGRLSAGGVRVGFGWHADSTTAGNPTSCFVEFSSGNSQHIKAYVMSSSNPGHITVQSFGPEFDIPAGNVDFELTYHRSINALSLRYKSASASDWSSVRYVPLNAAPPRFEVTHAAWTASVSSMTITARSGGSAFYRAGSVDRVIVQGGVMIGSVMTGSLGDPFTIEPVDGGASPVDIFSLCDRILIMDP